MNIFLWILQLLLAAMFAFHGWLFTAPPPDLVEMLNAEFGQGFRIFIGVAELLAAVGLILPGITRIRPQLIVWAAAGLAIIAISATVFHLTRGEFANALTTLLLFIVSVFVAYMRSKVNPILPRHAAQPSY